MKAVITAGGLGNRLKPITDKIPKPLVEVKGKPIIQHQIEWLKKYGIKDILITVGYKHKQIIDYFGNGSKFGVKLNYFIEEKPIGNAGAFTIGENKKWLDETFIVIFGDVLTNLDIYNLLDFHNSKKSDLTIVLQRRESLSSAVKIDSNNMLTLFIDRPKEIIKNTFNNASIYLINENIKEHIKGNLPLDFSKDIFPYLVNNGFPIYGFVNDKFYWREVGVIDRLNRVNSESDKAVFIDVDGVLCENAKWGKYVDSVEKFKWLNGARKSIERLNSLGFYVFIATNKACINKGLVTEVQIKNMFDTVFKGLPIQEVFICPHRHDEGCECRKPKSGLILEGILKYNLKPENCWVIGDNDIDVAAGEKIGCNTILVGDNGIRELEMRPDFEVKNISEAVKTIGDYDAKS
jgi:histidinol-phosphate phosphatase family protein